MFNTSEISLFTVNKFLSDEVHIAGKASNKPVAILSFIPVDEAGSRIEACPVIVFKFSGEAYNAWYSNWDGEKALYSKALELLRSDISGVSVLGIDASRLLALPILAVSDTIKEVLN